MYCPITASLPTESEVPDKRGIFNHPMPHTSPSLPLSQFHVLYVVPFSEDASFLLTFHWPRCPLSMVTACKHIQMGLPDGSYILLVCQNQPYTAIVARDHAPALLPLQPELASISADDGRYLGKVRRLFKINNSSRRLNFLFQKLCCPFIIIIIL